MLQDSSFAAAIKKMMRDEGKGAIAHAVQFSSHFGNIYCPIIDGIFNWEVSVDLICQARLSDHFPAPVSRPPVASM
jgi:hypothetical protein